jgi:hypothetical protein
MGISTDMNRFDTDPTSRSLSPPLKRKRTVYSCQSCRRKKVKCDTHRPCTHCVSANAVCTYEDQVVYHDTIPPVDAPKSVSAKGVSRLDSKNYQVELNSSPAGRLAALENDQSLSLQHILAKSTRSVSQSLGASAFNRLNLHKLEVSSWPALCCLEMQTFYPSRIVHNRIW